MSTSKATSRSYHLTPDRFVVGLLVVEVLLLLSDQFRWFPFNDRKGWTVLIGMAVLGAAILVLLAWCGLGLILRRSFRFGLRSLLLFVLVCAVVCSWFAVKLHRARKQREAAEEIVKAGGGVFYDYEAQGAEPPAAWLRKLFGDDFFGNVKAAFIRGPKSGDGVLGRLKDLAELEVLYLEASDVNDADLEHLRALTRLKFLNLWGPRVTDAGLEHLTGLTNLEALALNCPRITDAGIGHLRRMTSLRDLDLICTRASEEGVKKLKEALPNCRVYR